MDKINEEKSIEEQREELMKMVHEIEDVNALKEIYEEMCAYLKRKSFRIVHLEEKQ